MLPHMAQKPMLRGGVGHTGGPPYPGKVKSGNPKILYHLRFHFWERISPYLTELRRMGYLFFIFEHIWRVKFHWTSANYHPRSAWRSGGETWLIKMAMKVECLFTMHSPAVLISAGASQRTIGGSCRCQFDWLHPFGSFLDMGDLPGGRWSGRASSKQALPPR